MIPVVIIVTSKTAEPLSLSRLSFFDFVYTNKKSQIAQMKIKINKILSDTLLT